MTTEKVFKAIMRDCRCLIVENSHSWILINCFISVQPHLEGNLEGQRSQNVVILQ